MNSVKTFIAESEAMKEKLKVLDKIAGTDSPVLILGESGVGKELFAEQVHIRSERREGPFISVNCAALPESLAENELFGHVKGAFSGAENESKGRLELAGGGTLFLDEIADIAPAVQAKLLRFLAEKTFEKVGGGVSLTSDVRIVAATNKNLEALVRDDYFRKDLYYRLNVLPVRVPPLRERADDVAPLAAFFLKKFGVSGGIKGFTDEALNAMRVYSWPGNARELSNCVERACVISTGDYIQKDDLLLTYNNSDDFGNMSGSSAYAAVPVGSDMKTALNEFKKLYIKKTLEQNNWNQTHSAKVLDMERTYLSRLVKELNIERD